MFKEHHPQVVESVEEVFFDNPEQAQDYACCVQSTAGENEQLCCFVVGPFACDNQWLVDVLIKQGYPEEVLDYIAPEDES